MEKNIKNAMILHLIKSKNFYTDNDTLDNIINKFFILNNYNSYLLNYALLEDDKKFNYKSFYKNNDSLKKRLIPIFLMRNTCIKHMLIDYKIPTMCHCGHIIYLPKKDYVIGYTNNKIIKEPYNFPEKCLDCEKNGNNQVSDNYVQDNMLLIKLCDVEPLTKDEIEYLPCLLSINEIIDDLIHIQLHKNL